RRARASGTRRSARARGPPRRTRRCGRLRRARDRRKVGLPARASAGPKPTIAAGGLSQDQRPSRRPARGPPDARAAYPAPRLAAEPGELAEHAKKAIRDDAGTITAERRAAMARELGDVLWYLSQLASELELDLDAIAEENLSKLLSRQRRGVLSGSGDER